MLKILFSLSALLLASNSFAEEASQAPAKATENYVCPVEKKKILDDLTQDVTCTHDEECSYFNYGYPWQPEVCTKAIVNKTQQGKTMKNLALIEQYDENCIQNDEAEKKKFSEFVRKYETTTCSEPPRVYCFKGFCRTKSYAIYNDK